MLMPRRRTLLQAGVALTVTSAGVSWGQAPAGRKIILGQSVPLTGAASEIGLAFAAGAKLYVDAFNGRKNGPGWTLELRQLDDGYDATRAAANARKLLADGADVLFGFVGTASAEAGAAVARSENAIFFAPFAASDTLREATSNHVFHVRPGMTDEAFKMVRHCATLGQSRIAVVAEDDPMGRAGLAAVNLQPQAVIQVSLFNTTAAFIRKMRKTGYGGTFMNFSAVGIDPLFTALGNEIGGVVVSQVVPSPLSTTTPIVREYLAVLESTDQTPSYESLEGFIAAKTLAEAVRRTGKTFDKARLQSAMATMTDYDVGGFRINLRAGTRDSTRAIDLVTIRPDGKVVR